jgi:hypothetical protein
MTYRIVGIFFVNWPGTNNDNPPILTIDLSVPPREQPSCLLLCSSVGQRNVRVSKSAEVSAACCVRVRISVFRSVDSSQGVCVCHHAQVGIDMDHSKRMPVAHGPVAVPSGLIAEKP